MTSRAAPGNRSVMDRVAMTTRSRAERVGEWRD
jgi:hypothetical protein